MTTANNARQTVLSALVELGVENIGAGNGVSVALPIGAHLLSIGAKADVAFDGTTNTIAAGDGTTVFISDENVKVTTAVAADSQTKYYPSGGTITFTLAETGTSTVGAVYGWVTYVKLGRHNENQA